MASDRANAAAWIYTVLFGGLGLLLADRVWSGTFGTVSASASWVAGFAVLAVPIAVLAVRRRRPPAAREAGSTSIQTLTDEAFLRRLAQGFRRHGYGIGEPGPAGRAAGIGLVLTKAGRQFLVHCRAWKAAQVDEQPIRELMLALAGGRGAGGLVVTLGEFTEAARACAEESNVGLVSGAALIELVQRKAAPKSKPKGPVERKEPYFGTLLADVPQCPRCGGPLVPAASHEADAWVCSLPRCVAGR